MSLHVRFVTTSDHVRIAVARHGRGRPLVFVRGWISHLEQMWQDRALRGYFEALGRAFEVTRFDMRGNGMSDRDVPAPDLEAMVRDVDAVVADLGTTEPIVLYGQCYGGPAAITYAARHPERVAALILDGTYARGDAISTPDRRERILSTLRDLPEAGLALLSHYTHPSPEGARFRVIEGQAATISQRTAYELYAISYTFDVSAELPRISCPVLVLHRRESKAIPFRLGRELASGIAGARLVPLPGVAHNPWDEHPEAALAAIGDFLGVRLELPDAPSRAAPPVAGTVTILFTDMESSTASTARMGDDAAQELLAVHNNAVRGALAAHGGREIKHTGDGIMASFASPSGAVECAVSIQRALAAFNEGAADAVRVRIGLNAGEPVAEGADFFGTSVILARRLCDYAQPGEILASNVVRELCAGKRIRFERRPAAALKGFEEDIPVFAVPW